ncbi:hypothetical protein NXW28_20815 [Bacteroides fragilis]|nr:hypothetical protein [Bacteroides fragilis]MCS3293177.1 hypothetical protein [Bacteroides fragilis]
MGNTPYVVIVNEKSDEGQKVLEALEENIEKMDIGSHRELVIFFFRMAEPSAERSQKREKTYGNWQRSCTGHCSSDKNTTATRR